MTQHLRLRAATKRLVHGRPKTTPENQEKKNLDGTNKNLVATRNGDNPALLTAAPSRHPTSHPTPPSSLGSKTAAAGRAMAKHRFPPVTLGPTPNATTVPVCYARPNARILLEDKMRDRPPRTESVCPLEFRCFSFLDADGLMMFDVRMFAIGFRFDRSE